MSSELEISDISVAVGDCSVTKRRRRRPPYKTGKTVHVHAKPYKHNEDGCTAPGVPVMVPYRRASRGTSLRELDYDNNNSVILPLDHKLSTPPVSQQNNLNDNSDPLIG